MSGIIGKKVKDLISDIISEQPNVERIINKGDFKEIKQERILDGDEYLKYETTTSTKGFIYERLWDLCIKFGIVDELTLKPDNSNQLKTCHIFGNPNSVDVNFNNNSWKGKFDDYLDEPIQSGNTGGYSDITFINKLEDKESKPQLGEDLVFISVKYFQEEKGIADYDIGKLCTLIEKHKRENRNIKLYLFVKSKSNLIDKLKKQQHSSNIMIDYINPGGNYENIYDQDDLKKYFYKLRLLLEQYNFLKDELNKEAFKKYLGILKTVLIPRFHQELFIKKINELLDKKEKNILVGAIPRSGKSYIMMGTILDYVKKIKQKNPSKTSNFVIITPAPNETFPEYKTIFNDYIDFENNNINYVEAKPDNKEIKIDYTKNNVIIVSKQKLGWGDESNNKKILTQDNIDKQIDIKKNIYDLFIKDETIKLKLDLIFLDEAHFGISTDKAKEILKQIDKLCGDTPKVFVTATYNKPLGFYGVTENAKITWNLNDIETMKKIDKVTEKNNEIRLRFGKDIYDSIISNYSITDLNNMYGTYPKPYLITSIWEQRFLDKEIPKTEGTEYGFDMDKLFTVKQKRNDKTRKLEYITEFENEEQIKVMLMYYFGFPDKDKPYIEQHIYRRRGIIPRIRNICANYCRTLQLEHKVTTQLWFLPYGNQRPIKNVVLTLLTLLNNNPIFKDIQTEYYFYVALPEKGFDNINKNNVKFMRNSHNIKSEIEDLENKIRNGKLNVKNLIILSGARLQLGISLRNVDIVTLWSNITSSDAIFQMLFRSMTEVSTLNCEEDKFCPDKKFGFMVDLNPQRALTNTLLFGENIKGIPGKSKYEAIADLVNIDEDVFKDKYGTSLDKKDREQFVNDYISKFFNTYSSNYSDIKKLAKKIITYDEELLKKEINNLRGITIQESGPQGQQLNIIPGFNKTRKVKKIDGEPKKPSKKVKKEKEVSLVELASEVLSEFLSLLNIFTLYNEDSTKIGCFLNSDTVKITDFKFQVEKMKQMVYKDSDNKKTFLQILNSRLGRKSDELYPEKTLDIILQSIDEENKTSTDKIMQTQKKKYYEYTIENPGKLLEYINQNLTPKDKERKEKGEVFTPMWLVNEMLDKLPKEVWTKSDYKWLDPAVGIGNFPIAIYLRLMKGLESEFPNEEERKTHILENMIYMIDISDKNIFILKKIFCSKDKFNKGKYELNIHKGSFFHKNKDKSDDYKKTGDWVETFKVSKFHCIVGNPPYNKGWEGRQGGVLWKDFVFLSWDILNINGYLTYIHPLGWRKPFSIGDKENNAGRVWYIFKQYNLIFMKISDKKIDNFPKVDYYIVQKKEIKNFETRVVNEFKNYKTDENMKLSNLQFIPNFVSKLSLSIINKLLSKTGEKIKVIYDQSFKAIKKDTEIIPNSTKHAYAPISSKDYEISYKKYDKIPEYVSKPKIILTRKAGTSRLHNKLIAKFYSYPMGTTAATMYLIVENSVEGKKLENFFNSKLLTFLIIITQYSDGQFAMNEFKILNLINNPEGLKNNPTDKDIYDYYKLTKEEIKLIEEVTKSDESKKTKKNAAAKNNSSMKNNNTNHNGGGIRSKKQGRRSKTNN